MPKNETFSSYLFDIRTIDKTHNKVLAHELKMHFKLLNSARKLFLKANAAKKLHPLALENLSLRNFFFLFYLISTQTIYIYQKCHEMNGFVKLRAVSKLSTFLYTPCIYMNLPA